MASSKDKKHQYVCEQCFSLRFELSNCKLDLAKKAHQISDLQTQCSKLVEDQDRLKSLKQKETRDFQTHVQQFHEELRLKQEAIKSLGIRLSSFYESQTIIETQRNLISRMEWNINKLTATKHNQMESTSDGSRQLEFLKMANFEATRVQKMWQQQVDFLRNELRLRAQQNTQLEMHSQQQCKQLSQLIGHLNEEVTKAKLSRLSCLFSVEAIQ